MSIDVEDTAREIWRALEGISDGDGKAILREALAEAWEEGFDSAAETSGVEYGDNPYREDRRMTITEFLTARLDEDEAVARELLRDLEGQIAESGFQADERGPFTPTRQLAAEMWAQYAGQTRWRSFARGRTIARFADPARVLADIAAKRAIVALLIQSERTLQEDVIDEATLLAARHGLLVAQMACRSLTQPYAEHPDFNPAWRV